MVAGAALPFRHFRFFRKTMSLDAVETLLLIEAYWKRTDVSENACKTFYHIEILPHRDTTSATSLEPSETISFHVTKTMDGSISMWESTDGLKNWHDTGNSIFRETTGKPFWGRTVSRNMTTLDAIIERNAARHPMWKTSSLPRAPEGALLLKMDVQGAEKLVLRGSMRHVVPRAGAILAELSVLQYNSGAPLAFEMHAMLHELGFPLYDILALHHNTRGLLVQLDGLFLRKDHRMWRTGTRLNLPESRHLAAS